MLRTAASDVDRQAATDDAELDDLMSTVVESIEAGIRLEPVRFVGFEANAGLVWSFVSVWASAVAYLVQQLYF